MNSFYLKHPTVASSAAGLLSRLRRCIFPLLTLLIFSSAPTVQAQVIAGWDMNGSLGNQIYDTVSTLDANLNASFLSRSDSLTASANINTYNATNYLPAYTTQALAEANKKYYQFSVNAKPGYSLSLDSLGFKLRRSNTGPNKYIWKYSTDGVTYSDIPGSLNNSFTSTLTGGVLFSVPLNGFAALQNVSSSTTIYFRLYEWGSITNNLGTFGFGRSLVVGENSLYLKGTVASLGPQLFVSTSTLTGFNYLFGTGPSASQSFNVSGTSLNPAAGNIAVAATADYEISLDDVNFVAGTLNLPYAGGALAATPVYVRLRAGRAVGNYNGQVINVTGGSASGRTVTCDGSVAVFVSSNSDVIAVGASETANISSTITDAPPLTIATGVQVWSFTIRDGGASAPDADALPTIVQSITFAQSSGNAISDWAAAIRSISLFEGSTLVATGTVTPTQVVFSGLNYSVPDDNSRTLTVRLSLNCPVGVANKDGEDFGFSISNANFTTDNNTVSSQKAAFPAIQSANGSNVLNVARTQLVFTQQPSAIVGINTNFSPAVLVAGVDGCGNLDVNFTSVVSITSTGTLLTSPSTANAVNGIASFPGLSFTAAGGPFTLTAASVGLTSAVSTSFTVASTTSLGSGDMMIVGFDTYVSSGSDILSIANFVPLLPGTSFTLANVVYDWKAPANVREDRWYNGNSGTPFVNGPAFAKFTWNGASNIATGSIICVTITGSGFISDISINGTSQYSSFTVTNATGADAKTNSSNVAFSSSAPDAIFLMQGDFVPATTDLTDGGGDLYRTFNGTVFGGIQTYGTFQPFTVAGSNGGARVSRVHPSIECVGISTGASAAQAFYSFYEASALHNGSHRALIRAIAAYGSADWTVATTGNVDGNDLAGDNTCANTFTVSSNVATGLWTGETSSDWFNCNNWDDFTVPNTTTNVLIAATASNDAVIDYNSTKAEQYSYLAYANTVNIIGRKLTIQYSGALRTNTLNITGNLTINTANGLDMNDGVNGTADGRINIGGDWINNFSTGFDEGESLINFNSTTATQTIDVPDGETFYNLTNSNTSPGGTVIDNNNANLTVTNILNLTAGTFGINTNTLILNGTVSGAGTISGSATSNLTIGGTAGGGLGTLNFTAGSRVLNNLSMIRTGASPSAILGTDLQVNNLVSISSGILDAASTTLNGAGGLTMTGGELQLAKTGTVPELTGTYALSAGTVTFKGTGSQTIRPVNYFNLTSTSTGARVFANGSVTGIGGAFTKGTNAYTFTGSTVDYNSSGAQSITAFSAGVSPGSTYHNLRLSNNGVKTLGGAVDVENELQLNNSITLALGANFLNLKSTATQTARVAPVSSSVNITYGAGRFVVERYFPGRRAWRMITAPVTAAAARSLFNSWQVGGNQALPGSGTYITGPNPTGASGNGLDDSPQDNFSIRTFNTATSVWDGVSNTKTNLIAGTGGVAGVPDNIGYFMFVRGDRTPANVDAFNQFGTVNETTLRDTGFIQHQNYIFNCNPNTGTHKYTVIGNPYASPVDFDLLSRNNVDNKFHAWDPKLNTVGGYVVVDRALGTITPNFSTQTNIIQSKQAVLVETTGASPTVTFSEAAKSATNNLTLFRPSVNRQTASLNSNLYIVNADGSTTPADGNLVQFDAMFSNASDQLDAVRFTNINETFGIANAGNLHIVDRRPFPVRGDSIQFNLRRTRRLQYRLQLEADKLAMGNLQACLEDRYRKTSTPIKMNGTTDYDFEVNADAASAAADRLYIVFRRGVRFTDINAVPVVSDVVVNWQLENDGDLQRFEVERAPEGGAFEKVAEVTQRKGASNTWTYTDANLAPGVYSFRVKGVTATGVTDYTEEVQVKITARKAGMYVYPNPVTGQYIGLQMAQQPAGIYQVRLLSAEGSVVLRKQLVHDAGTATEQVQCPAGLPAGTYRLEVTGPDKRRESLLVMVGR